MPEFHFLPEAATRLASQYDLLWWWECTVAIVMTLLIFAAVFFLAIKYRRRSEHDAPPAIEGSLRLEIAWSVIPFIVMLTFFWWGAQIFFANASPPAPATTKTRITRRAAGDRRGACESVTPLIADSCARATG